MVVKLLEKVEFGGVKHKPGKVLNLHGVVAMQLLREGKAERTQVKPIEFKQAKVKPDRFGVQSMTPAAKPTTFTAEELEKMKKTELLQLELEVCGSVESKTRNKAEIIEAILCHKSST